MGQPGDCDGPWAHHRGRVRCRPSQPQAPVPPGEQVTSGREPSSSQPACSLGWTTYYAPRGWGGGALHNVLAACSSLSTTGHHQVCGGRWAVQRGLLRRLCTRGPVSGGWTAEVTWCQPGIPSWSWTLSPYKAKQSKPNLGLSSLS